jgi:17beta-estradiol 17-dehydrogenase / very-long-chain 3-oxoacyl-CoA reductase
MRPSAATYAERILAIVGCGKKSIMPYWPHAVQTFIISLLPEKMIDNATKKAMQKELNKT